ncbi:unnamed protein product [Closterium sp. NIES-53]
MHRCFGSGARSLLFAIPLRASSPLALFVASSLASPPTPHRGSSTTRARVKSSPPKTSPFNESVCYYRLHPHASHPVPLAPLLVVPVHPPRLTPSPHRVDPPPLVEPLEISSGSSGLAEGGDPAADDTAATHRSPRLETPPDFPPRLSSLPPHPAAVDYGVETAGAERGGAEAEGEGFGGAGSRGAETEGADSVGAASPGGGGGSRPAGGTGTASHGGAGAAGPGGPTSAGGAGGAARGTAGAGGTAGARGTRGATSAGGTRATSPTGPRGAGGARVACTTPPLLFPQLLPHSPLLALAPYTTVTESLIERRQPETRASTPEHREPETRASARARVPRVRRSRASVLSRTHDMTLRPSSVPQRIVLPSPPGSSLPANADPPSDLAHTSSPTVTRFLATVVTDPTLLSPAVSALVAELVDFAAGYRLDYLASLVSDPDPACPPSVGGEVALGCDVLEDKQEELECLAAAAPHLATMLLAPEGDPDALDIPTPRSYREAISGTYVDEVPPTGANIVSGMRIFRVKRPSGSPPAFKARYVARGFSQREGVDLFQTFSPTPKMTTLRVLLHVAAQRDYELHSLDFSTAILQGSLHMAIWLRRPPGFTGSFPKGTQRSLRRPVYGLRQAPDEWHSTRRTTLAALGFAPSTADTSLFLRTDTTLLPFYLVVYVNNLVLATAGTETLALVKAELQERHTCTDLGPSVLRLPVLLATSHSSVY